MRREDRGAVVGRAGAGGGRRAAEEASGIPPAAPDPAADGDVTAGSLELAGAGAGPGPGGVSHRGEAARVCCIAPRRCRSFLWMRVSSAPALTGRARCGRRPCSSCAPSRRERGLAVLVQGVHPALLVDQRVDRLDVVVDGGPVEGAARARRRPPRRPPRPPRGGARPRPSPRRSPCRGRGSPLLVGFHGGAVGGGGVRRARGGLRRARGGVSDGRAGGVSDGRAGVSDGRAGGCPTGAWRREPGGGGGGEGRGGHFGSFEPIQKS